MDPLHLPPSVWQPVGRDCPVSVGPYRQHDKEPLEFKYAQETFWLQTRARNLGKKTVRRLENWLLRCVSRPNEELPFCFPPSYKATWGQNLRKELGGGSVIKQNLLRAEGPRTTWEAGPRLHQLCDGKDASKKLEQKNWRFPAQPKQRADDAPQKIPSKWNHRSKHNCETAL